MERKPNWIIPAILFVGLMMISLIGYGKGAEYETWAYFGFCIAGVFGIAAVMNAAVYYGDWFAQIYHMQREARAITADAMLLKNVRGVHPQTIKLVFGERARVWMIRAGIELPDDINPYSVLYSAPDVTEMFVWYFLEQSTTYRCMPKRMLSDKAYRFDPLRKCTDYEQYDKFVALLRARNMITDDAPANGTSLWIPPWIPELIAKDFGLEWDGSAGIPELKEGG